MLQIKKWIKSIYLSIIFFFQNSLLSGIKIKTDGEKCNK